MGMTNASPSKDLDEYLVAIRRGRIYFKRKSYSIVRGELTHAEWFDSMGWPNSEYDSIDKGLIDVGKKSKTIYTYMHSGQPAPNEVIREFRSKYGVKYTGYKFVNPMTKNSLEYPRANPVTSASQYALMQAIAHGAVPQQDVSISQELAREMIRKTPRRLRSKFAAELAMRRHHNATYVTEYYDKVLGKWLIARETPNKKAAERKAESLVRHKFERDLVRVREKNPIMNPSAEELTETWHGREPKEVIDYEEEEEYEPDGAVLAELEELGIILEDREQTISIEFEEDPPMLVANVNTETLEVVGGDQSLQFGDGWKTSNKTEVSLGYVYLIAYCTDKHHLEGSNGVPESYEHFFGEEFYKGHGYKIDDYKDSEDFFEDLLEDGIVDEAIENGYLPTMVYDTVNEKIKLVGGKYTIEDVGLRD